MSRPIKEKSLADATGDGTAGSQLETGGRITISLFVVGKNLDTSNDTLDVALDGSMDGSNWVEMNAPTVETADFTDVGGNGDFAAMVTIHGAAVQYVRARIVNFTDNANSDLAVDAWVGASANSPTAKDYREVT